MNKTVTRSIATGLMLVLSIGSVLLLAQSDEQREKFKKEREAYFTEHLELTDSESKAFWPLYNDFHNRKMKIAEDERNAFSYAHKNAENLSDKEITETLDKIRQLKEEQLNLETEYYKVKFMKVLPPKKVLKLYKVEWDFRRYLLRQLRSQRDGKDNRRDRDEGKDNRSSGDGGSGSGDYPGPMGHLPGPGPGM